MFEVPAAKRVKRSQLFGSDGEDEQSSIPHAGNSKAKKVDRKMNGDDEDHDIVPDYGFEYDFVSPDELPQPGSEPHKATAIATSKPADKDTETYQFNLFAPSRHRPSKTTTTPSSDPDPSSTTLPTTTSQTQAIQISIRSPSPIAESEMLNAGTLINPRPDSYYFTSALPPKKLQTLRTIYSTAAVSQSTLSKLTSLAWPGSHYPWRRIVLPAHRKQIVIVRTKSAPEPPSSLPTATATATVTEINRRRARPSKKRRDLAKTRAQRRQILIDESKTKEEHEREKKNKKNRERKLKRRAKERREKEMKSGGSGGGGGGEEGTGNRGGSVSVDESAD